MGLLILIVTGAAIGWLASVLLNLKEAQAIAWNTGVAVAGALIAGLLVSAGGAASALSPVALLGAVVGSVFALAAYRYLQRAEIR